MTSRRWSKPRRDRPPARGRRAAARRASDADLVIAALAQDTFRVGVRRAGSRAATAVPHRPRAPGADARRRRDPAQERVLRAARRRQAQLAQIRRHLRLKALLEIWLYVHVPLTVALLAALTAHMISVFYYW